MGGARHDDRRRLQAGHPLQRIRLDSRAGTENDLPRLAADTRLAPQLVNLAGGRALRQHHQTQTAGIVLLQKAADPPGRPQQFAQEGKGLAGPAQHHDVVLQGHRCQTPLQIRHLGDQPAGQDGDQGTHEHHIATHRQQGGDKPPPVAHIVPEVARVRQPQERPPDSATQVLRLRQWQHQQTTGDGDESNKHRHHQQLEAGAFDQLPFNDKLDPVDKS